MNAITLIFPHQLFTDQPALHKDWAVYLVEESLFFNQYTFHKQKLILHRASMKSYQQKLVKKNYTVNYIEATEAIADTRKLVPWLAQKGITEIHYTDTIDNWLEKRLSASCRAHDIALVKYNSPNFLNQLDEVASFFSKKKSYFQTDFYIDQRKSRNILLEANGQPIGGKWSFDSENRKRFPKNEIPPVIHACPGNALVAEAKQYVSKHFAGNYGADDAFIYPIDHAAANNWLTDFLDNRFKHFGMYEDAMVEQEHFLYHSILTPALNIGLLSPGQVIEKALEKASEADVPLNSVEGFIRQVMGWREFIRIVYEREGSRQRTTNYWQFTRKIPASFWRGETGIDPVDAVIKKVLKTGYTHHIERLMVMGNFMLLCEFDPDEVYRWFMEMYVDSYDWVMVPNVYGMTQFADGGLMTTKPYISGSNYLLKMGDWKKGKWQDVWDGLFWRFMHVHRDFFSTNPRLGMLLKTFDKMDPAKKKQHLRHAEGFLEKLDKS